MKERTKTLIMFAALAVLVVGTYEVATHRPGSAVYGTG
jgi:hypothetical protein